MRSFTVRRALYRVLSSPVPVLPKRRNLVTVVPTSVLRATPRLSTSLYIQKRTASNEPVDAPVSADHTDSATVGAAVDAATNAEARSVTDAEEAAVSGSESSAPRSGEVTEGIDEAVAQAAARSVGSSTQPAPPTTPTLDHPVTTPGVYVGNLPFEITEADLISAFEPVGNIVSARVVYDNRGLSKGFGFVQFGSVDQAKKAIESFNGQELNGRRVIIQPQAKRYEGSLRRPGDRPQRQASEPTTTLYIGNMAFEMSDQDMNELFRPIKNVVDVRIAIDRQTGRPRGFAHADFVDVESAVAAFNELNGKEIHSRKLRVDYTTPSRIQGTRSSPSGPSTHPPTTGEEGVGP